MLKKEHKGNELYLDKFCLEGSDLVKVILVTNINHVDGQEKGG